MPAQALTNVIKRSKASTMMGLDQELKEAAASLERCAPSVRVPCCAAQNLQPRAQASRRSLLCAGGRRCNETAISLKAGCQLFLRYTTRTSALDAEDFEAAKRRIIEVLPRGFSTSTALQARRESA